MFRQILSLNNKKAFVLISSSGRVANSSIFSMYQVEIRGIERLRDQRRKKCLALCSRRQVSENASQLTVICDFWAHYKSHFLFNMVFSFCCVFFFFFADLTTALAISANYVSRFHYVAKERFLTNTLCLNLQATMGGRNCNRMHS